MFLHDAERKIPTRSQSRRRGAIPEKTGDVKVTVASLVIVVALIRSKPFGVRREESVPAAARPKALVCGRSPAEIMGSNPTEGMDVCCECCVLSGRGLCDELITRPEESYRLWCVVCVLETS